MLKFKGNEGCEAFINDEGCLVIKQHSVEFGKDVCVILTPAMAWEIAKMVEDFNDEMVFSWADGMVK